MTKEERTKAIAEAMRNATAEDLRDNLLHLVEVLQAIEHSQCHSKEIAEFSGLVLDDITAHAHNRTHPITR